MWTTVSLLSALLLSSSSSAHPLSERGSLLSSFGISDWAHEASHPAVKLFAKRQDNGATPGSAEWLKKYPSGNPNPDTMPQEWKDALAAATAANLIPDIVLTNDGVYPSGSNPGGHDICSSAYQCRADGDIWDAPDGMLGVSFDDGPTTASPTLYEFLKSQNQRATHFMIGQNIRNNVDIFMQAFNDGNDIASHTYTHRWMTSLSNEELVAEFGWTLQIVSDLTGGRVPKFWRPPYGDSDNRVRAIAKNIFGMVQVDWNQDTDDWELGNHQTTQDEIATKLKKYINGPKSPGLIILEHELYPGTVQAFVDAYALMKSAGWDTRSIPALFGSNSYQNAADDTAQVTPQGVVLNGSASGSATATATAVVSVSTGASTVVTITTTVNQSNSQASATQTTSSTSFGMHAFERPSIVSLVATGAFFLFLL